MSSSQPSILAVEDDKSTRVLLRHTLKDLGDLTVVEGEAAALEAFDAKAFDLLLLDINLQAEDTAALGPERSGVELLHKIRERSGGSDPKGEDSTGEDSESEDFTGEVPAVAVTAYALPGDRDWLLDKGFDEYVEKPFTMGELREVVFEALPDSEIPSDR